MNVNVYSKSLGGTDPVISAFEACLNENLVQRLDYTENNSSVPIVKMMSADKIALRDRRLIDRHLANTGCVVLRTSPEERGSEGIQAIRALRGGLTLYGRKLYPKTLPGTADDVTAVVTGGPEHPIDAHSTRSLAAHQDGISIRGSLTITGLSAVTAPSASPLTWCQNVLQLGLHAKVHKPKLYAAMFHPRALVVRRLSDDRVFEGPVLGIHRGAPVAFYRAAGERHSIGHKSSSRHADELLDYLDKRTRFDSSGVQNVELSDPGEVLLINNSVCVHGRTAFPDVSDHRREVAARWWTLAPDEREQGWIGEVGAYR